MLSAVARRCGASAPTLCRPRSRGAAEGVGLAGGSDAVGVGVADGSAVGGVRLRRRLRCGRGRRRGGLGLLGAAADGEGRREGHGEQGRQRCPRHPSIVGTRRLTVRLRHAVVGRAVRRQSLGWSGPGPRSGTRVMCVRREGWRRCGGVVRRRTAASAGGAARVRPRGGRLHRRLARPRHGPHQTAPRSSPPSSPSASTARTNALAAYRSTVADVERHLPGPRGQAPRLARPGADACRDRVRRPGPRRVPRAPHRPALAARRGLHPAGRRAARRARCRLRRRLLPRCAPGVQRRRPAAVHAVRRLADGHLLQQGARELRADAQPRPGRARGRRHQLDVRAVRRGRVVRHPAAPRHQGRAHRAHPPGAVAVHRVRRRVGVRRRGRPQVAGVLQRRLPGCAGADPGAAPQPAGHPRARTSSPRPPR